MAGEGDAAEPGLVAGRYRVLDELGRGGMGVVWRALDEVIGRAVALKELRIPPGTLARQREVFTERVLREARAAGQLNDPAVVTVHDVIASGDAVYLVMELVAAPTLAEVVAQAGPLPAARVERLGLRVLSALEAAHRAGITHRDVKPSNIMVLEGDRVKLADFGIAQAADDPRLTAAGGGVMGSPGYLAPELFGDGPPSSASDLWSLGATLGFAVEGAAPFERGSTAATLNAILHEEPSLARCAEPLASVIRGLLARSPAARLTADRVRELLDPAGTRLADQGEADVQTIPKVTSSDPPTAVVGAPPRSTRPHPTLGRRRGRTRAALVGAAVLTAIGLAVGAVLVTTPDLLSGKASNASSRSGAPAPSQPAAGFRAPPPAKPPLTPLVRYYHDRFHYSTTDRLSPPAGYAREHTLGSLALTQQLGTHALYACKASQDEFSSTDPTGACEGQTAIGALGWIYLNPPPGTASVPLFRCVWSVNNTHFDSTDPACEGQKTEGTLGYLAYP